MTSQVMPSIFSGPCFGDSTPSESSTLHMGMDTPTSSPLTLGPPLVDMEDLNVSTCSTSGSNKITEHGLDASQVEDVTDQVIQRGLDGLPSMSCQRILPDFNSVLIAEDDSFEKSRSSNAESSLNSSQQNLAPCEQEPVPGLSCLQNGETGSVCAATRGELSEPPLLEKIPSKSFESEHPTINSSLDPDFSQTSFSDILLTPASSTFQNNNSALRPFPTMQVHPIFSHGVDVEPCERSPSSLVESFKSSGGLSDDILPRPTFNGENEELRIDTYYRLSKRPENHSAPSVPLALQFSNKSEAYQSNLSQHASHSSTDDHDPLITAFSLTMAGQIDQSHEETGTGCVSDHFNVPSSSRLAKTEYSQSDPYFTPATIFRVHSPDFRTDVVGIHELSSSSPPSSPSMNSNYMPSSSPIPSSSPTKGQTQTPPSSPPVTNERYVHELPVGVQEPFYGNESYPAFPHYHVDHRPHQPIDRHESDDFYTSTTQHSSSISEALIPPPFMPGYYDHAPESLEPTEQYTQNEPAILVAPEPLQPTPGPSHRLVESPGHNAESTADNSKPYQTTQKTVIPNPKRPTLAGVRSQQKKLSKPFRSPIIHPPVRLAPKPPTISSGPLVSSANSAYLKEAAAAVKSTNAVASSSQTSDPKIKHRTTRAASQFKSPLSSSSTISDEAALVRLTPTIQSLERKLQLLRRALKVREDVQEEVLDGLVDKWSEAGREVAWEVWDAVKDNANTEEGRGTGDRKGKKRAIEESWGWDDSGDSKKPKQDEQKERNWGWDVVPVSDRSAEDVQAEGEGEIAESQPEEMSEDAPQPSLGTMLIQLGIAPETLGWNEEEGAFVENERGLNG